MDNTSMCKNSVDQNFAFYLHPPDLMPAEGVFSRYTKENHKLSLIMLRPKGTAKFGMVSIENCYGHISRCGYV